VFCTARSLRTIRSTFARFGTTILPANRTGPDPKITPTIKNALLHQLAIEPDINQQKMVDLISDKFEKKISVSTIVRALKKRNITHKVIRQITQQQQPNLQHFYYYRLKTLGCRSYHLVFIDEFGIDKPGMFQRKGWAPKGVAPVQKARF
jgi:hypothetical protein